MNIAETIGDNVTMFETFEEFGHNEFWVMKEECYVRELIDLMSVHEKEVVDGTTFRSYDPTCPQY